MWWRWWWRNGHRVAHAYLARVVPLEGVEVEQVEVGASHLCMGGEGDGGWGGGGGVCSVRRVVERTALPKAHVYGEAQTLLRIDGAPVKCRQ